MIVCMRVRLLRLTVATTSGRLSSILNMTMYVCQGILEIFAEGSLVDGLAWAG